MTLKRNPLAKTILIFTRDNDHMTRHDTPSNKHLQ